MGDVVCAVRGGPGSYETRLAALQHAHDTGDTVHLISVIDPIGYDPLHRGQQHAIRAEMAWRELTMGKATVGRAGLGEAPFTVEVRVGALAGTIAGYVRELGAATVMIGRPRDAADAVLAPGGVEAFADGLRAATGVRVLILPVV